MKATGLLALRRGYSKKLVGKIRRLRSIQRESPAWAGAKPGFLTADF
jgi:hypothetical protein